MRPPSRGPRVGPRSGPRRYQPNIPARSVGSNMSEIVPPPLAMPTPVVYLVSFGQMKWMVAGQDLLPKNPDTVLTAISVAIFGANAVGICSSENATKH
jgi:hypothetical protein